MLNWTPEYWNQKPYMKWAGARVLKAADGRSTLELLVQEHHRGAAPESEAVNGAILAYLHDVAQGVAVCSSLSSDVLMIATISLNIDYLLPMLAKESLYGDGTAVRIGGGIAFAQSEFRNAEGIVCSRANGTFRIRREPKGQAAGCTDLLSGSA